MTESIGMNRQTGSALQGSAHIAQSIGDILNTPLGSRVMRRDYGSMLPDLIDQPLNAATRALFFGATALAISRWEPRLNIRRVSLSSGNSQGELAITIEGDRTDLPAANNRTSLSIPIRTGGVATGQN